MCGHGVGLSFISGFRVFGSGSGFKEELQFFNPRMKLNGTVLDRKTILNDQTAAFQAGGRAEREKVNLDPLNLRFMLNICDSPTAVNTDCRQVHRAIARPIHVLFALRRRAIRG
jgi:hypothetical protein